MSGDVHMSYFGRIGEYSDMREMESNSLHLKAALASLTCYLPDKWNPPTPSKSELECDCLAKIMLHRFCSIISLWVLVSLAFFMVGLSYEDANGSPWYPTALQGKFTWKMAEHHRQKQAQRRNENIKRGSAKSPDRSSPTSPIFIYQNLRALFHKRQTSLKKNPTWFWILLMYLEVSGEAVKKTL